ncbi:hypothetical protein DFQ28_000241 [Apophysomyces sp. BC1034]|nr:hypothetical protein DFQ30_001937 [Apophysomyces sp. BC1015]KAG0180973.1 hypothetical protein DFQ29_009660 [Apophysomyces sp. BC1021]KAG0191418.1 hypothetical protein DFQ28_000241 [Apophysomyces sp. BC1034]
MQRIQEIEKGQKEMKEFLMGDALKGVIREQLRNSTIEEMDLAVSLGQRTVVLDLIRRPKRFNPVGREVLEAVSKGLIRDLALDPAGDLATGVVEAMQNALDQVCKMVIDDFKLQLQQSKVKIIYSERLILSDTLLMSNNASGTCKGCKTSGVTDSKAALALGVSVVVDNVIDVRYSTPEHWVQP